jgi:hypothetical protein
MVNLWQDTPFLGKKNPTPDAGGGFSPKRGSPPRRPWQKSTRVYGQAPKDGMMHQYRGNHCGPQAHILPAGLSPSYRHSYLAK